MSATFTKVVTLEKKECGQCSGVFALTKCFVDRARTNAGGYYCPYCSTHWSWTETEADRLRKAIAEKEQQLSAARSEAFKYQQIADIERLARTEAERKIRRSNRGVCTCCRRSFQDLARHMATQHGANTLPVRPPAKRRVFKISDSSP